MKDKMRNPSAENLTPYLTEAEQWRRPLRPTPEFYIACTTRGVIGVCSFWGSVTMRLRSIRASVLRHNSNLAAKSANDQVLLTTEQRHCLVHMKIYGQELQIRSVSIIGKLIELINAEDLND